MDIGTIERITVGCPAGRAPPMQRLSAIFIVLCMALIAGALGFALFVTFGLSGAESTVVAVAVLTALALYNAVTAKLGNRTDVGSQVADLSRGTGDLARQVGELSRKIAAIEARGDATTEKVRAATEPLAAELGELGALMRQLAESVAVHDAAFTAAKMSAKTVNPYDTAASPPSFASGTSAPATSDNAAPARLEGHALTATIRDAVDANRVDLHLQPIVTLPQRKVRYYEALTRLRTEDGHMLQPAEFLAAAETSGLLARIDNMLLFRSVQVVRRLLIKNREIGVFCNISLRTLNDPQLFPQMSEFLGANRAIASSLILEFTQNIWRQMGPMETESLSALREMGFRFGMDQVTDLRLDPRDLGERGIRFVKVPAAMLLGRAGTPGSDIHAEDLSNLLGRHGISLIGEMVESESQAVDLLDYDVKFGQGFLFSPPRPVRAEALQAGDAPIEPRAGGSADPSSAAITA